MASLLTGQSVGSVAKEYNIPRGTVANWSAKVHQSGLTNVSNTKKGEQIGDLILDYLGENLRSLTLQAKSFSNPEWLRKQTASDAAVLHGVMTDKAIRLIEALSNATPHNNAS